MEERVTGGSEAVRVAIIDALRNVYDPEIPVNIFELGLIYGVALDEAGCARVTMTLTSPMCPVAESLPPEVAERVKVVAGVADCKVEVVWDPPWSPEMMSDVAKIELDMY
jgi:FeS assembly SUF system protein